MADQTSLFGSDNPAPTRKNTPPNGAGEEPLAARMRPRTLDDEDMSGAGIILETFANLNTPGDLAALMGADG